MDSFDYVKERVKKQLNITHLISTFYYKCPDNFCFDGEVHGYWEFIYVDKGRMLITADQQQYLLNAGELAFHRPNEFHAVQALENVNSNFIVAAFSCKSACMKYFEKKILSLNSFERQCLYKAVEYAAMIMPDGGPVGSEASDSISNVFGALQLWQSNLEQMLLSLHSRGDSVRMQSRIDTYMHQNACTQMAELVKIYLEEHLDQMLTLQKIAQDLCCSIPQMNKLFHKQYGRGIIDYFIDLKISEAKRLIKEGKYNFTQISARLGYDNFSYFSRMFKERTNMTMTECARSIGR